MGRKKAVKRTNRGASAIARIQKYFPQVRTVSDATKHSPTISVKEVDVKRSQKSNFKECAFAKACQRQLKMDGAFIGLAYSYLIKGTHATRYVTPPSVAREITTFDRHRDFDEGEYRLSPVAKSQALGVRPDRPRGGDVRDGTKGKPIRVLHFTSRVRSARNPR